MSVEDYGRVVIPQRVAERAATRYAVEGDCHVSTYSTASHGYAQIGWQDGGDRFVVTAHRAAWVHAHGQIPRSLVIDHICHNRRCVRIEHLRLLTNEQNSRINRPDYDHEVCRRGHLRSEHTVVRMKRNGHTVRMCGICYRDSTNESKRRKAARERAGVQ